MINKLIKEDFNKGGIYYIKNTENNKYYIGSTKCFRNRYYQHCSKLKQGKHHNIVIQNVYNKYGADRLEFGLVEITNDLIIRETYFINEYDSYLNGYNINPNPVTSPSCLPHVVDKISKTLTEKYKEGTLQPTKGCFKKGNTAWNKGIKYRKEQTECMRVPKTITEELQQAWQNSKLRQRARANSVNVFDKDYNLLYVSNSLSDLQEWSQTDENFLPIKGNHGKKLVLEKVCKACKSGKSYKGLYFKSISKPRIEEIL